MTDVGTTPRKYLTALQKLKLFEDHKGKCALCGNEIRIGEAWIVEHMRALALGGTNEKSNLAPAHIACAQNKTSKEDAPRIAKSKRQKASALGCKDDKRQRIKSAGFPKRDRTRNVSDVSLNPLPRRPMYEDL